jgi:hypothetical protein
LLFCGYCKQREIPKGDPVLFITIGAGRQMRRCVDCSGPAPPDLPPLIEQKTSGDFGMVSFASVKPKTRGEFKQQVKKWTERTAKYGETVREEWMPYRDSRDPGEEG